eukprot:TRINITY_DN72617_c0_g1_i1.p1 TRINITY_DN72617_c0_g1~~TRINITY_DN72617_c0_g1_i1.p1  ORF type:complete len:231 (-),score=15.97 TRINITY_DN72617_c0_g1_i1:87-779(-)
MARWMEPNRSHYLLKRTIAKENAMYDRQDKDPSQSLTAKEEDDQLFALLDKLSQPPPKLSKSASAPGKGKSTNTKPYRMPAIGEEVVMTGMRSRPDLNGASGEIVGHSDREGFLTLRLFHSGDDDNTGGKARLMKVRPHRLLPLDYGPLGPHQKRISDEVSARTCSTPGSLAQRSSSSVGDTSVVSCTSRASSKLSRNLSSGSVTPCPAHFWQQTRTDLNLGKHPTAVIL